MSTCCVFCIITCPLYYNFAVFSMGELIMILSWS